MATKIMVRSLNRAEFENRMIDSSEGYPLSDIDVELPSFTEIYEFEKWLDTQEEKNQCMDMAESGIPYA